MLVTAVTTRPCSKDIAHGPDAIKADIFESRGSIEEKTPRYDAFHSLFPDFLLFLPLHLSNLSNGLWNVITYSRIYQLSRLLSYFSITRIRDILSVLVSTIRLDDSRTRRGLVSFLIVARASNDGTII